MVKQVLVYRRDLKMRKGKIAAQCAHASMKVFFDRGKVLALPSRTDIDMIIDLTPEMKTWVEGMFTKIVLSVENEEDLLKAFSLAALADLPCALITDAGATEFKKTCTDCDGDGYREWLTGCPQCGTTPPCSSDEECSGPDEVCTTCKGAGKVSVPTNTAIAIGPAHAEAIDLITGPEGQIPTKLA
jgi:PTH2 family peptidyl-tRNA hydrolase